MRMEWIEVYGRKSLIYDEFQRKIGMDKNIVNRVLAFLEKEKNILREDETFLMTRCDGESSDSKMLSFMIMEYNYYINVRATTIFIVSLLIDNKINLPVISSIIAINGMKRLVEKIEEDMGTKCILLEILRRPDKMANADILNEFRGECCNNDMGCNFREESRCKCTHENVTNILFELTDMGILKKQGTFYKYDPWGSL